MLVGVRGRGGTTRHAQLGEDVLQVPTDRVLADEKIGRDLLVGLPGGNVCQHFTLACRQQGRAVRLVLGLFGRGQRRGKRIQTIEVGTSSEFGEDVVRASELERG